MRARDARRLPAPAKVGVAFRDRGPTEDFVWLFTQHDGVWRYPTTMDDYHRYVALYGTPAGCWEPMPACTCDPSYAEHPCPTHGADPGDHDERDAVLEDFALYHD